MAKCVKSEEKMKMEITMAKAGNEEREKKNITNFYRPTITFLCLLPRSTFTLLI